MGSKYQNLYNGYVSRNPLMTYHSDIKKYGIKTD